MIEIEAPKVEAEVEVAEAAAVEEKPKKSAEKKSAK